MKTRAARQSGHKATHPNRHAQTNKSMRRKTSKRQEKKAPIPAAPAEIPAPNPVSFETKAQEAETGQENAVALFEVVKYDVIESPNVILVEDESEIEQEESEEEDEAWTEA